MEYDLFKVFKNGEKTLVFSGNEAAIEHYINDTAKGNYVLDLRDGERFEKVEIEHFEPAVEDEVEDDEA